MAPGLGLCLTLVGLGVLWEITQVGGVPPAVKSKPEDPLKVIYVKFNETRDSSRGGDERLIQEIVGIIFSSESGKFA